MFIFYQKGPVKATLFFKFPARSQKILPISKLRTEGVHTALHRAGGPAHRMDNMAFL